MLRKCLFCLADGACEIRFDRKGRPYVVCQVCHTRSFVRSMEAIRGLAIGPTLLAAAIQRRAEEPEFRKWFDGEITKTIASLTERPLASPARDAESALSQQKPVPFSINSDSGSA